MPFALLLIGIVMLVAAVRNTQADLVTLIRSDFSGPGNFFYWVVALLVVGAIGYIPKLKPVSDGLLLAIILGLVLSKGNPKLPGGGFFKQFTAALSTTNTAAGSSTASTVTNAVNTVVQQLPTTSF